MGIEVVVEAKNIFFIQLPTIDKRNLVMILVIPQHYSPRVDKRKIRKIYNVAVITDLNVVYNIFGEIKKFTQAWITIIKFIKMSSS